MRFFRYIGFLILIIIWGLNMKKILFLDGFSNLFNAMNDLKKGDYHVISSSRKSDFIGFMASDEHFVEPELDNEWDLLAYLYSIHAQSPFDVVIASRTSHQKYLARLTNWAKEPELLHKGYVNMLNALLNVKMVSLCDEENLKIINNKVQFYENIKELDGLNIPEYHIYHNDETGLQFLRDFKTNGKTYCTKPSIGIYGSGFFIFDKEENDGINRLQMNTKMSIKAYVDCLKSLPTEQQDKSYLLMPFLPNNEFSADCVAIDGEIKGIAIREKINGKTHQIMLSMNEPIAKNIYQQSQILAKHFKLNGLFNVQFKNDEYNTPHILEINSRMSGKSYYATHFDVNLPLIFIDHIFKMDNETHLGKRHNIKVNSVYQTIINKQ